MKETWNLLDSRFHDAATNMAIDEMLIHLQAKKEIRPTIRFYGWNKPSLSIGRFQEGKKAINFQAVEHHDCEFVRRLTGGSAVLHDQEITYSIIVSEQHSKIPTSINEAYYVLAKGLLEGYRLLGVDAQFAIPKTKSKQKRTDVCFEQPAIYEMLVNGKKISGNAQTRKNGVLLQHGSIPIRFDIDMLFDLFQYPNEEIKQQQKEAFYKKATSIYDVTKRLYTYDELRNAFLLGFEKALQIQTEPFQFNDEQWKEIYYLAETKYRSEEWNFNLKHSIRSI